MLICCFLPILDSRLFLVVTCFITVCRKGDVGLVDIPFITFVVIITLFVDRNGIMLEQVHVNKAKLELLVSRGLFQVNLILWHDDPWGLFRTPSNIMELLPMWQLE